LRAVRETVERRRGPRTGPAAASRARSDPWLGPRDGRGGGPGITPIAAPATRDTGHGTAYSLTPAEALRYSHSPESRRNRRKAESSGSQMKKMRSARLRSISGRAPRPSTATLTVGSARYCIAARPQSTDTAGSGGWAGPPSPPAPDAVRISLWAGDRCQLIRYIDNPGLRSRALWGHEGPACNPFDRRYSGKTPR